MLNINMLSFVKKYNVYVKKYNIRKIKLLVLA
jgi:hypothetical protein